MDILRGVSPKIFSTSDVPVVDFSERHDYSTVYIFCTLYVSRAKGRGRALLGRGEVTFLYIQQ